MVSVYRKADLLPFPLLKAQKPMYLTVVYDGASDENRTHVCSLEGCRSTIELHSQVNGVSEGNRTLDPLIKSQLLYHLSYRDIVVKMAGAARFELTMRESKSLALPLGYAPIGCLAILLAVNQLRFFKNGGDGWFRTTEPRGSRFTVCRV